MHVWINECERRMHVDTLIPLNYVRAITPRLALLKSLSFSDFFLYTRFDFVSTTKWL